MTLQELKNLREYSKTFFSDNRPLKPSMENILIENDIHVQVADATTDFGQKKKCFKPLTDNYYWSNWRVGIPVKYKGSKLMLWVKGYHRSKDYEILWYQETIWNIDTNREMRKTAQERCWTNMIKKANILNENVSDITLTRWIRPLLPDGWECNYNGTLWAIYPAASYKKKDDSNVIVTEVSRAYWVEHSQSGRLATHCKTLKEAKIFIKMRGAIWMNEQYL